MHSFRVLSVILFSMISSLLMVRWVFFKILRIAREKNMLDVPEARKLQNAPVPVLGGMAVFLGTVVGLMAGNALYAYLELPDTASLLPVLGAMVIMLYVGWMDDVVGLTPMNRIVVEILTLVVMVYATSGCIDTFHGMFGIYNFSWYYGVPLTILAGVGIINAVNMIDGVNGLASGLCMVACVMFGITFLWVGDAPNAVLAFSMAAALLPFIMHNVFGSRSKMFLGDSGTMVMGIVTTWFVISMLRSDSLVTYYSTTQGVNMIALSLAIVSVPVADTLRVMTMRMANGKSPLKADKTHLHHVFIKAGVSHAVTALMEIGIDCLIVLLWALSVKAHVGREWQLVVVIVSAMVLVWGTYAVFRYNEIHHTAFMHRLSHFSVHTHLGHKNWWKALQEWLDKGEEPLEDEEKNLMKHLSNRFVHADPEQILIRKKEQVLSFVKGKSEVHVKDIKTYCGVEEELVSDVLLEEIEAGRMQVIEKSDVGEACIVAYVETL